LDGVYSCDLKQSKFDKLKFSGACSSISYDYQNNTFLASFKYTPIISKNCHVLFEENQGHFKELRTIFGPPSKGNYISKTNIFTHMETNHIMITAGDEETKQVDIWDGSAGTFCQKLTAHNSVILDVKKFDIGTFSHLMSVSDQQLLIHKLVT